MVIINLIGNLILMKYFLHVGLAMSTAIASWVQIIICVFLLKRFNLQLLPSKSAPIAHWFFYVCYDDCDLRHTYVPY